MTLIERYTGSIDRKHIVEDKPLLGNISQYTFGSGETDFSYENSTSLPENKDRFQNKDLNITAVGDKVNERILERNLKEDSNGFIRIMVTIGMQRLDLIIHFYLIMLVFKKCLILVKWKIEYSLQN